MLECGTTHQFFACLSGFAARRCGYQGGTLTSPCVPLRPYTNQEPTQTTCHSASQRVKHNTRCLARDGATFVHLEKASCTNIRHKHD